MQIGILINDKEYREALIERLSDYDNDLFVNVITGPDSFSKDCLILTDIDPGRIEKEQLTRLIPRTLFLTASSFNDDETDCHRAFKYSSVAELLSEASIVYKDWHGIGYGRDYSAKIIAVCSDNDTASSDRCMSLARQIIYRKGDRVLVIGLGFINDYGCDEAGSVNRFARMMYAISTGRHDAAYGYTYTDSYGVSALILKKGRNPLAFLDGDELMGVISSLATLFDTLILDIGTCYREENMIVVESSDNILFFENGRRQVKPEEFLNKDASAKVISISLKGETEDVMAIDDVINQIYGSNNDETGKS